MVLQSSGKISIGQIKSEFQLGGRTYLRGSAASPAGLSTTGTVKASQFYAKYKTYNFTYSLGTMPNATATSSSLSHTRTIYESSGTSSVTFGVVTSHVPDIVWSTGQGDGVWNRGNWRRGWATTSLTASNGTVHTGMWFGLNLPSASFVIRGYTLAGSNYDTPASWVVLGSSTGTNGTWVVVDTKTTPVTPVDDSLSQMITYTFASPQSYRYYRLLIKSTSGFNQGTLLIGKISFYGNYA